MVQNGIIGISSAGSSITPIFLAAGICTAIQRNRTARVIIDSRSRMGYIVHNAITAAVLNRQRSIVGNGMPTAIGQRISRQVNRYLCIFRNRHILCNIPAKGNIRRAPFNRLRNGGRVVSAAAGPHHNGNIRVKIYINGNICILCRLAQLVR